MRVCVLGRSELSNLKTGWLERGGGVEGEDVEGEDVEGEDVEGVIIL